MALLGLARRAGAVAPGIDATRRALRRGEARLVVVATDAAEGQLKKVEGLVRHQQVPVMALADRVALGQAVGAPPLSALAVIRDTIAQQLLDRIGAETPTAPRGSRSGR